MTTKRESVQENKTHKILWDFKIQTEYLIPARRPDKEKKNSLSNGFCCSAQRMKLKESEEIWQYIYSTVKIC